jgi:hypothetical protein
MTPLPRLLPRAGGLVWSVGRVATVTGIAGNVLMLTTPDGWGRSIDATSIPITRDGATIAVGDVRVGDEVRLRQARSDDGTVRVTRIEVLLTAAIGTVASVGAGAFELTAADGSAVTVRVSDATTWLSGCRATGSLEALQVGATAVVRGIRATDGSIDATHVATLGRGIRRPIRRGRTPEVMPTPTQAASPVASPATV